MTPDYCSLWPEVIASVYIGGCCKIHDDAFDAGGSLVDFALSNIDLGACIAALSADPVLLLAGLAMIGGTTLFGLPFWIRAAWRRRAQQTPSTNRPASSGLFHAFSTGDPAMSQETTFRVKAPWIMEKLLADFPIGVEDAAAIVGNLGHESGGFALMQEIKPTVAGSRGGYGWAQWTGPRRRAFEAYCERNGLDPASDKANYAWLFLELKGEEKRAISAVVGADGLDNKVEAFEQAYERAGIKHYPSRKVWARRALDLWQERPQLAPVPETVPVPTPRPGTLTQPPIIAPEKPLSPVEQSGKAIGAGRWTAVAGALWTVLVGLDVLPPEVNTPEVATAVLTIVGTVAAAIGAYRARDKRFPVEGAAA